MPNWKDLPTALAEQEKFSDLFFRPSDMDDKQKQEVLKTFVLSLHAEATGIADAVNYKDHRLTEHPVDTQRILYKSVDAYRYLLAIMNLWGISGSTFASALQQKDDYLHYRHALSEKKWSGQPIVLFDIDDVLADFRGAFCDFVTKSTGIFIDPTSTEYYNATVFKKHGLNNEFFFRSFLDGHGFYELGLDTVYFDFLRNLKAAGFWIQLVTSRPDKNVTCFYDTYSWLSKHNVPADSIVFTPEKLAWLVDQPFYSKSNTVFFAVDDSAKHSAEYSKHGVTTVVPQKSYNSEVAWLDNVIYVPNDEDPFDFAKRAGLVSDRRVL